MVGFFRVQHSVIEAKGEVKQHDSGTVKDDKANSALAKNLVDTLLIAIRQRRLSGGSSTWYQSYAERITIQMICILLGRTYQMKVASGPKQHMHDFGNWVVSTYWSVLLYKYHDLIYFNRSTSDPSFKLVYHS